MKSNFITAYTYARTVATSTIIFSLTVYPLTGKCWGESDTVGKQSFQTAEITIQINEKRPNGNAWDDLSTYAGAEPAPDVFGKVEFEKGTCEIDTQDNAYIVHTKCKVPFSLGQKAHVQLYDSDTLRINDEIGVGYIDIDANPVNKTIGSAKISIQGM